MEPGKLEGCLLDHYRVESLIGRGGMGEVYRAHDTTLNRPVALKVLAQNVVRNAASLARFVHEARTASALNHPHVVAIYQVGTAQAGGGEVHYIAMEFVDGDTLGGLIQKRQLDLKRMLDYLIQAAEALAAAHSAGIVHRDFKPDNVMAADRGYVKVVDFGLAKLRDDAMLARAASEDTPLHTAPGAILGTIGYMSPEQAEGRTADQRSDIFSFGCVLYEAATGQRAFSGKSSVDTLHRIIHDDPQPISAQMPSAPSELQRIVRKCLSKDPETRYQSMKEVAIDLRALRHDFDSSPSLSAKVTDRVPSTRRTAWILAIAALLIIAIAAGRWFTLQPVARDTAARPMQIERLTGSGNVIDAAISPDGKYIAYVESAGGRQGLWLRQMRGNQPLELVPAQAVGFWGIQFSNDSSSIYYAIKGPETGNGRLFQIPVLGGTPRTLLDGIDSTITFSNDGKQIAYLRQNFPDRGASSLMLASSEGGDARALLTKHAPNFLAPGFFIAPSWSADGKQIAVGMRNTQTRDAGLLAVDASTGAERAFPNRYLDVTFTHWMPDGSGILYVATPPDRLAVAADGQIWYQPFPSGVPKPVTNDLVDYRNITVSGDGKSFVTVGSDWVPTLWIIPIDGKGDPRRVVSSRADGAVGMAWDPNGTILFSTRAGGEWQIARMNVDGTNRRDLTVDNANASPQITRDGKTIVFLSSRPSGRGVWSMNADGTNPRLIADVPDSSYPAISPDGRTVFFSSSRDGQWSTWKVAFDGGSPELVTSGFNRAAVSPDGQKLAGIYGTSGGSLLLGIANVSDGKVIQSFAPMPLTTQGGSVQWAPDGKGILFTAAERTNIWLQKLDGGPATKVTNFTEDTVVRFAVSPDGKSIVAARGSLIRDAFLLTNFR